MSDAGGLGGSGFNDVTFGAAGSILDTIYGAKRLFGRSGDHYGIHNRNAERTGGFVTPLSRVGLCIAALFVPAIAAPIFVAIILAAAVYYVGKMSYSIYKAYGKNDNEESRRRHKADIKKNVINAAIATALAIVVVALFFSPIGFAAAIALTAIAYAVSISYAIFSMVRLGREMTRTITHPKADTPVLPDKAELNVDHDLEIIHQAQARVSYSEKSKLDNYFRMNRTQVVSQISHQDNAEEYLISEITNKIDMLQHQIDNGGLFGGVELSKRQAKRDLLLSLRSYLLYLHAHPNEYDGRDPIDAFEAYVINPELAQDFSMTPNQFHQKMRLARQSFFSKVGDFEDILEACDAYFRYRSDNQFASGPRPQLQQAAQAAQAAQQYQPGVFMRPQAQLAPEFLQPPARPAPVAPEYQQPPAGYQPLGQAQPVEYPTDPTCYYA